MESSSHELLSYIIGSGGIRTPGCFHRLFSRQVQSATLPHFPVVLFKLVNESHIIIKKKTNILYAIAQHK